MYKNRFTAYFLGVLFIATAAATVVYEIGTDERAFKPREMYPDFANTKHEADLIQIRSDRELIVLKRQKGAWRVLPADNFPASEKAVRRLYERIETLRLIEPKTQIAEHFGRINLLNPPEKSTQTADGTGTRITIGKEDGGILADFIIGEPLKSFISGSHHRFFMRYARHSGAYLVETDGMFGVTLRDYLYEDFGMPALQEIRSVELSRFNKTLLRFDRVPDEKDDIFVPPKVPAGTRLIYPGVGADYVKAISTQLRPIDAVRIESKTNMPAPLETMTISLRNGKKRFVDFITTGEDNRYMRIRGGDKQSLDHYFLYRIATPDYKDLIRPMSDFLMDDPTAGKIR